MKAKLLLSSLLLTAACPAAVIVDDFSGSLSAYTLTKVNDTLSGSNVSFSTTAGALQVSYTGTSAVEQVLFLRNDQGLGVGQTLTIDTSVGISTQQMDFGLAIAGAATPTNVGTTGDTRNTAAWLSVSLRPSQDAIRVNTSGAVLLNGSLTQPTYNPSLMTTGNGVLAAVETSISQLFIERLSTTTFVVGYIDTSSTRFDALTVDFVSATDIGSQIGFYSDLRAAGSIGTFDNLTIVPEPSAALLGGLGLLGLLRRRRA